MSRFETSQTIIDELIARADELIRSGRINEVVSLLSNVNFARVPRPYRHALAKIARRCGLVEEGLALLHPVIRNEKPLDVPPTPKEICEYAVLLSRNGLIPEALALLSKVDSIVAPEALLYRAFCHISAWDYGQARPFLENYLAAHVDDYSKLIARVNLASCLVTLGDVDHATVFLTETIAIASSNKATRLVGNCLEMRAQVHLRAGDRARAIEDLNQAQAIFGETQSYDRLLIDKWRAVLDAEEAKSAEPLRAYRAIASQRQHWESVRDADLLALKIEFDQRAYDHLIYGSPLDAYRARVREQLAREPSAAYVWGDVEAPRFSLETAVDSIAGKKIHQTIACLMKDFYTPRRTGSLFAELYPDEHFDVQTSNLRVRQLMKRTRHWFDENEIPLVIEHRDGGYRLVKTGSFGIEMKLEHAAPDTVELRLRELSDRFEESAFTISEACEALTLSKASLQRLFDESIMKGKIERTGIGKATKYRCLTASTKTRAA